MPERLQVVDENNNPVGLATREEAWEKGLILRNVNIILRDPDGNILLQLRSLNKTENPGKWTWAASGHVDEGDDYVTAARRELFEEIGIEADLEQIGIERFDYDDVSGVQHYFTAAFSGKISRDTVLKLDPSEVAQTRWFTPNELHHLVATKPDDFTHKMRATYEKFFL